MNARALPTAREGPALDQRLVQVALAILADEGVGALTLRRIARAAGVSHGAPLRHYRSLADLLSEVAAHGFRMLADGVGEAGAQLAPIDALRAAGRAYVTMAVQNAGLFSLMFRPGDLDFANARLASDASEAFEQLVAHVRRAQGAGWQRDRETRVLAGSVWASVHGLATLWSQGAMQGPVPNASLDAVLNVTQDLVFGDQEGGPDE